MDIENYHKAYHADAVAPGSFTGTQVGPYTIDFDWDGSDIHNERKYLINRSDTCGTGEWEVWALADKNESDTTVTDLPSGWQAFQILPLTFADPFDTAVPSNEVCIELIPPDLSGVYDLLVHYQYYGGLLHCIVNLDHTVATDTIVSTQQCNNELPHLGLPPNANIPPTWEDTCVTLGARIPSECAEGDLSMDPAEGRDGVPGPPPPPPYSLHPPSIGSGEYYPNGDPVHCPGARCSVITWCEADAGSPDDIGPNVVWQTTIFDPAEATTMQIDTDGDTVSETQVDRVASGEADISYNKNEMQCDAGAVGIPTFPDLPVLLIEVYEEGGQNPNANPAWWRTSGLPRILDFDGDGCADENELKEVPPSNCGDDPYNPTDSFNPSTVDLSGAYDIMMRVTRGDCNNPLDCAGSAKPGEYFSCRSYLDHDMSDNSVIAPIYCYHDADAALPTPQAINPEAYPGITGDGFWGAPPPGPEYPSAGSGFYAFGDVDETHTILTGTFVEGTSEITLSGCLANFASLENVWIDSMTANAHQLPETDGVNIYPRQADCSGNNLTGAPLEADVFIAKQPRGELRDADQDGVPIARELGDLNDAACGRRDPFNPNDYYDVSIPRDGVIDLPNDILGVILHFAPGGYEPGDENWDRPPTMIGAGDGSTWNRGSPDGVIDLPNDILGVILQFNPGGCPPLD